MSRYWVSKACGCGVVYRTHSVSGGELAEQFNDAGWGVWGNKFHAEGCPSLKVESARDLEWREVSEAEYNAVR